MSLCITGTDGSPGRRAVLANAASKAPIAALGHAGRAPVAGNELVLPLMRGRRSSRIPSHLHPLLFACRAGGGTGGQVAKDALGNDVTVSTLQAH